MCFQVSLIWQALLEQKLCQYASFDQKADKVTECLNYCTYNKWKSRPGNVDFSKRVFSSFCFESSLVLRSSTWSNTDRQQNNLTSIVFFLRWNELEAVRMNSTENAEAILIRLLYRLSSIQLELVRVFVFPRPTTDNAGKTFWDAIMTTWFVRTVTERNSSVGVFGLQLKCPLLVPNWRVKIGR